jgi:hypothetical protein
VSWVEVATAGAALAAGVGAGGIVTALIRRPTDQRLAEASQITAEAARTTAEAAIARVAQEHLEAIYEQLRELQAEMRSLRDAVQQHLKVCTSPPDDVLRTWRHPPRQRASGE